MIAALLIIAAVCAVAATLLPTGLVVLIALGAWVAAKEERGEA